MLAEHPKCDQKFVHKSYSVEELFRAVRNIAAHKDPQDPTGVILSKVRASFKFLIMQGFSIHSLYILKDETLSGFAERYFKELAAKYQKALEEDELTKVPHTHFKVKVTYKKVAEEEVAEEETVCFFDVTLGLEAFVNNVNRTVKPPKKSQRCIVYNGLNEPLLTPPLAIGTVLDTDVLLSKLDNSATHLIHIKEV